MKVFISQAMNGLDEEIIKKDRERAIKNIKEKYGEKTEIIDSYFDDYEPSTGKIALKYLAKSIELLADADVIYLVRGWYKARGCRIERKCALAYGIGIVMEEENEM